MSDNIEAVARAICRERCAFYGDPPCWKIAPDEYAMTDCESDTHHDVGCRALARVAVQVLDSVLATARAQTDAVMKDRAFIMAERDRTFAKMLERAEKAEAHVDMLKGVIRRTFAHHGYSDEQIDGAINAAIAVFEGKV